MWRVCSVHFAEECFSRAFHIEGCRRRLIPGSIPTIRKIQPGKQSSKRQHRKVSLGQFYLSFSEVLCHSYTCQLFLRCKREIFIVNTTRSFPKILNEFRSLPKTSEVFRSLSTHINAGSLPVLFPSKIKDREEGIVLYSFYTWFSFLTWV